MHYASSEPEHPLGVCEGRVPETTSVIDRARDAAEREAWAEAYELFGAAERSSMSPADLAAFADAAWWNASRDESLGARLEAYAGFDGLHDHRGAATAAVRLFFEHFYTAQAAEATGWLMRAQRHLAERAGGAGARLPRGGVGLHGAAPRRCRRGRAARGAGRLPSAGVPSTAI